MQNASEFNGDTAAETFPVVGTMNFRGPKDIEIDPVGQPSQGGLAGHQQFHGLGKLGQVAGRNAQTPRRALDLFNLPGHLESLDMLPLVTVREDGSGGPAALEQGLSMFRAGA